MDAPWLGAAFSVPTSTLLFWCMAPFTVDVAHADIARNCHLCRCRPAFPGDSHASEFRIEPSDGSQYRGRARRARAAVAVLLAWILLGEVSFFPALRHATIAGGVMLMFRGGRRALTPASIWMLFPPLPLRPFAALSSRSSNLGSNTGQVQLQPLVIGYTISVGGARSLRDPAQPRVPRHFDRRGVLWFATVGICNGLAVAVDVCRAGTRGQSRWCRRWSRATRSSPSWLSHLFLKEDPSARRLCGSRRQVAGVIILIVT